MRKCVLSIFDFPSTAGFMVEKFMLHTSTLLLMNLWPSGMQSKIAGRRNTAFMIAGQVSLGPS